MIRHQAMNDPGDIPDSYWALTAPPLDPGVETFEGDLRAETVVIGAGVTGLSTALHLRERGHDVLVIDANEPGWGATGRNNGQVVAALKHEPHEIEAHYGIERGRTLIDRIGGAPDLVFDLIARHGIACQARRCGIVTAAHTPRTLDGLRRRTSAWQARGVQLAMLDRHEMHARAGTDYYLGGAYDPRGGSINPLAYARGMAAAILRSGGRVMQQACVERIGRVAGGYRLELPEGVISAERVVIATNAYTGDLWPGLKQTFIPVRTPQLVSAALDRAVLSRILPGGEIMSDLRRLMLGVRVHDGDRLHLGGGGGTPGVDRASVYANMVRLCRLVYPFLPRIDWEFRWTGFMAMTSDSYPRLFELAPGLIAALGYSGRGLGTATLLGQEIAAWASGERELDALALPLSQPKSLPYYPIKEPLVEAAIRYYDLRDRLARPS